MSKTGTAPRTAKTTVHPPLQGLTTVSRDDMVREAAYYLYENNGREPGHELEYWLKAEAQVDQMLTGDGSADKRG